MRLPTLERDFWTLRSGEEAQREFPDTFWIPPLEERQRLRRGQAAKLMFEIETDLDDGDVGVSVERMWVLVRERHGDMYLGILDNQPATLNPGDDVYLCPGAEIPFQAEHVIGIDEPPVDAVEETLSAPPTRRWTE